MRRAFTLFELLLVVAILGIVLGVSFPRLKGKVRMLELRAIARKVFLLMEYAQTSAVLRNNTVLVHVNTENGDLFVKKAKDEKKFSRLVHVPSDIVITGDTGNIVFYPDGTAQEFDIALRAKSGKHVTISSNGLDGRVIISD